MGIVVGMAEILWISLIFRMAGIDEAVAVEGAVETTRISEWGTCDLKAVIKSFYLQR